jgi:hypothetical protein
MACCTPDLAVKEPHTADENCTPRSDVRTAGTPNLATQPDIRAAAQLSAVVERRGTASHQRVDLSIMVNRWEYPSAEVGRGPTRSICRCENRNNGAAIGLVVPRHLRRRAFQALPAPAADIGGETWPQITARNDAPRGPIACMCQAVDGVKNWPPKTGRHQRPENTERNIHQDAGVL